MRSTKSLSSIDALHECMAQIRIGTARLPPKRSKWKKLKSSKPGSESGRETAIAPAPNLDLRTACRDWGRPSHSLCRRRGQCILAEQKKNRTGQHWAFCVNATRSSSSLSRNQKEELRTAFVKSRINSHSARNSHTGKRSQNMTCVSKRSPHSLQRKGRNCWNIQAGVGICAESAGSLGRKKLPWDA